MQYRLDTPGPVTDLAVIERAITALDAAAVLDLDPGGKALRVSTVLGEQELLQAFAAAGHVADAAQLERLPSECCGGCGG